MSKFSIATVLFFALICQTSSQSEVINDLNDLPIDESDRLKSHWLLHSNNPTCSSVVRQAWQRDFKFRTVAAASDNVLSLLVDKPLALNSCYVSCIERGTMNTHIQYLIPERSTNLIELNEDDRVDWIRDTCQAAEMGFLSYLKYDLDINWINPNGERLFIAKLEPGERNTFWTQSYLGHEFEITRENTNDVELVVAVEYAGVRIIGDSGSGITPLNNTNAIRSALQGEWSRSRRIQRTFTELGFALGQLPLDLFTSMSTYHYNNRDNKAREEWDSKGLFVNWWESDVYMIPMPWQLKVSYKPSIVSINQYHVCLLMNVCSLIN